MPFALRKSEEICTHNRKKEIYKLPYSFKSVTKLIKVHCQSMWDLSNPISIATTNIFWYMDITYKYYD